MFTASIDTNALRDYLTDVAENQIPFAASKMLNALALDVQRAERAHIHEIFQVRRSQWVDRNVKVTHWAKKTELYAAVGIVSPGDGERSDILGKFEDQTTKAPRQGGKAIVIPADAKRTKAGVVSKAMRPRALNLQQTGVSKDGRFTIYVGDKHTVMLQRPDGSGLIIQNTGTHVHGVQDGTVLYTMKPAVTIRPDLHFETIGERVVITKTAERWDEAVELAMRTSR